MSKNYELLSDRVKSLLERWDCFNSTHKDLENIDEMSVTGLLAEINDELTKEIVESSKRG